MPLSSFSVDIWTGGLSLRGIHFSSETLLGKTHFSFANGYQLELSTIFFFETGFPTGLKLAKKASLDDQ